MCEAGEPIEEPGRVYSDNPRGWPHRMARPSAEPLPCPLATIWSDGDEPWGRESLLAWGELVEPPNEMRVVQLGPLKGAGKAAGDVIVAEQVAGQVASLDVSDLAESTAAATPAPTDQPIRPAGRGARRWPACADVSFGIVTFGTRCSVTKMGVREPHTRLLNKVVVV